MAPLQQRWVRVLCDSDLDGARSPRLVLVREPDQLGVERAHPQLAFGVRLVELPTLDVDRPAGEEMVAAAVVEVQVCVDHDVDAGEIEVLLAQGTEARIEVGHRRVQLRHAGVDEHARIGMVDDVDGDRHSLALGE